MSPTDPLRAALETALGAQYEIVRLLGRGGMGAVYLARERALERTVAIKVLPPEIAVSAEAQERFRREARTAAKLTHPNIVPLHTFGEVEGMMYFVMGYVEGESLADRMQRDNELPPAEVRGILGAMADALHYAHRQGVIHRDIKPDNILLEAESGRPMLTDFGIAKASASQETLTELGTAIGTPHYMSPEQASGERDLDGRSDLYSLGVVGYAMLAGRVPFEGTSAQEVLVQHVTKAPPPLEATAPGVPKDLAKAIMRCLAKEPRSRWPDGNSLRDAVAEAGQADEVLIEKRSWFDGVLLGWMAPFSYLIILIGTLAQNISFGDENVYLMKSVGQIETMDDAGSQVLGFAIVFGFLWAFFSAPVLVIANLTLLRSHWGRLRQVQQMAFRQPSWWRGWYPRALRHPGSAARWLRLPLGIKLGQTLYDASTLFLMFTFVPAAAAALGMPGDQKDAYTDLAWPFLGELSVRWPFYGPLETGLVLACVAAYAVRFAWAKRKGLTAREAHRLAGGRALAPTYEAAAFWKKPHIAKLLLPESPEREAPTSEPETPEGYLAQVGDAARQLTGPSVELGNEAVAAARQLVAAVNALDKEIEQLARDVDPSEIPRLEEKLTALGDPDTESAAGREMRELLSNQLKLVRRMADALEHSTARRSRLMEMLNTLWLQMGNLRAEAARESLESEEVTGKIRAICEEIERHAEATEEIDQLVSPSETE